MIGWLQPSALWGLSLLATPLAIHLLRRRRAERVLFPTIRFVRPSRTAAVRLRPPSDLMLLALRLAVAAAAVLASAQPLWLSAARRSAWNDRTARAIVLDTSESMRTPGADNRTAAEGGREAAAAEEAGGLSILIEDDDLVRGLRRAVAWLNRAPPPARREIVVISDFQLGALAAPAFEHIDAGIGLRFIRLEGGTGTQIVDGVPLMPQQNGRRTMQRVQLTREGTKLRLEQGQGGGPAISPQPGSGLRFIDAGDGVEPRLRVALATAGTPAPDPARPITFMFGRSWPAGAHRSFERWMIETMAGIERDAELRRLALSTDGIELDGPETWPVLLEDRRGRPVARAAVQDEALIIQSAARGDSYFAAAFARAALEARYGSVLRSELEPLTIPAGTLSAWSRPAGPADENAWRHSDESDARWFWGFALLLLVAERYVRSTSTSREDETRAAA